MMDVTLQSERKQLLSQLLARHAAELSASRRGLRTRLTDGRDATDEAASSEAHETRSLRATMASLTSRTVQLVEAALGRLQAGTYESCSECGGRIPLPRLRALPFTDTCRDCQERRDLTGDGSMILA
jgi:DnaK suppressor protein